VTSVREIGRFFWVLICALLGAAFEAVGQAFMKCGAVCFTVGRACLHQADQLVEYALYEDWSD
jgi:hypothetical protein